MSAPAAAPVPVPAPAPAPGSGPRFYAVEINKTVWQVPERYQGLSLVGCGAYGQVWLVSTYYYYVLSSTFLTFHTSYR